MIIRSFLLAGVVLAAAVHFQPALAQSKYTINLPPATRAQYLQQHAIDVDDVPGHQVRVFQVLNTYSGSDLAFAGVPVKESVVHGISDYVNYSGPYVQYTVYTLQDGSKVFGRGAGSSQAATREEGSQVIRFTFTENLVGGTGKFKGIRGQLRGSGERVPGGKTNAYSLGGEYWLDE